MSLHYGRIFIDQRTDGVRSGYLAEEARRLPLEGPAAVWGDAQTGDLVEVRLEDGQLASVTLVARPVRWDAEGDGTRWLKTGRLKRLQQRHFALRAVREYLHAQGFWEVASPLLVKGACPDAHLNAAFVQSAGPLVTSTEYQLKRLLVGGIKRPYSLTQNFRMGDLGTHHNPEFTMLEWARAWETLDAIERDAEAMARTAADAVGVGPVLHVGGQQVDLDAPWERLSVRKAFRMHLNVEIPTDFSTDGMAAAASCAGVEIPASFLGDRHYVLSCLLDALQPYLGWPTPVFLREWPAFMCSSTAAGPDGEVGERSELFIGGLEIADGFPFLRDAALQRELFEVELARRAADGKSPVPVDTRYLEALAQGIPPGAGMALGVDRLMMALLDAEDIRGVMPFTWDEL